MLSLVCSVISILVYFLDLTMIYCRCPFAVSIGIIGSMVYAYFHFLDDQKSQYKSGRLQVIYFGFCIIFILGLFSGIGYMSRHHHGQC